MTAVSRAREGCRPRRARLSDCVASRSPRSSPDRQRDRALRALIKDSHRYPITVRDLIRLGTTLFAKAGLDFQSGFGSPAGDAAYLTYFGLGLPYFEQFFVDAAVTKPEAETVLSLFEERVSRRVNVQYITHEAFYFGNVFYVDENVLTPRSLMADSFQALLSDVVWENDAVLDLCTGSGCVGITIALMRPTARVDLVDISPKALDVARINVARYGLGDRVRCLESDLFSRVEGKYSLIVSNPPYVTESEYAGLAPEFKNEPRLALTARDEGLEFAIRILTEAPRFLTPDGTLMVEVGYAAEKLLTERYPKLPFRWWRRTPGGPSGAFVLRNGYPPVAEAGPDAAR